MTFVKGKQALFVCGTGYKLITYLQKYQMLKELNKFNYNTIYTESMI